MEKCYIEQRDLEALIATAIESNNNEALKAYKAIVECMIQQHDYDCESMNDILHELDDWEITHMKVYADILEELLAKINNNLN